MDVHLLVYDLSRGLARSLSASVLGFQLDALYHTAIELAGREYVYDGGIVAIVPDSSHLGRPIERLLLGRTELPTDVVDEYLDSVRSIFTAEAYDLFKHNCNNFSDSFAKFLVGTGIPDHILNMPRAVMDTPVGRMLASQLVQAGGRPGSGNHSFLGIQESGTNPPPHRPEPAVQPTGVRTVTGVGALSRLLTETSASGLCAVVFFTSATCPPCRALYPVYDQLAVEFADRAVLIKADVSRAPDIGAQYAIHATPTFVTFLHGEQENRWTGADPVALRANVRLLAQMARPAHPHAALRLPTLQNADAKLAVYHKVPPLDKVLAKMGDEAAGHPSVRAMKHFLEERQTAGPAQAALPDLAAFSQLVRDSIQNRGPDVPFALVDLLRCALADPRVSAFFAEEPDCRTLLALLRLVHAQPSGGAPYALRIVTLQTACNMLQTGLFAHRLVAMPLLRAELTGLVSSGFLDGGHDNVRVAAAALLFNLALADRQARGCDRDPAPGAAPPLLSEDDLAELIAAAVEAVAREASCAEALRGTLAALGQLTYGRADDSELADLLRALDAGPTVRRALHAFPAEKAIVDEIGAELLGKGFGT